MKAKRGKRVRRIVLRTVQDVAQEIIDGDEVGVEPILRERDDTQACLDRDEMARWSTNPHWWGIR